MAQLFRQGIGWNALRLCLSPPPLVGQQTEGAGGQQGEAGGFRDHADYGHLDATVENPLVGTTDRSATEAYQVVGAYRVVPVVWRGPAEQAGRGKVLHTNVPNPRRRVDRRPGIEKVEFASWIARDKVNCPFCCDGPLDGRRRGGRNEDGGTHGLRPDSGTKLLGGPGDRRRSSSWPRPARTSLSGGGHADARSRASPQRVSGRGFPNRVGPWIPGGRATDGATPRAGAWPRFECCSTSARRFPIRSWPSEPGRQIPNRGGSDAPKPPRDGRRRGKRVPGAFGVHALACLQAADTLKGGHQTP
jgi:hypothetical protein